MDFGYKGRRWKDIRTKFGYKELYEIVAEER